MQTSQTHWRRILPKSCGSHDPVLRHSGVAWSQAALHILDKVGGRVRRTKEAAEETRQRIIDAAELLFFQKGVSETTLEQIARKAGVTRGAFYWHFADKAAVIQVIYESIALPQQHLASVPCDTSRDPFDLIEESTLVGLRRFASDERQQRVYALLSRIGLVDESVDKAKNLLNEAYEKQRAQLIEILMYAESEGLMSENWTPVSAENALGRLLLGLYQEWLIGGRDFDLVAEGCDNIPRLIRTFRRSA